MLPVGKGILHPPLAIYTQRLCIISTTEVHQASAFVCSDRTKQLWCKAAQSKRGVTVHVMISASVCFFSVFPTMSTHLNMYPLTVYDYMDPVIMCCDWNPDPPNISESDKVKFFALNDITGHQWLESCMTFSLSGRDAFLRESSLKFRSEGLTVAVIFFKTVTTTTQVVGGQPSISTHILCDTPPIRKPPLRHTAVPKLNTAIRGAEIPTSRLTRTFLKWVKVRVSLEWGGFGMEVFPQ